MTQLKSITLSNIRRYSAETRIELSQGATILLAPNGTGKTAFFEAIEFSLTGSISRLGANLSPIIRDKQSWAKVILDFGDIKASAQVSTKGIIERTGDLSSLFPEAETQDIPYLLRLTHLLDQREGEWLVKAESKVAGAQLERLPIGKEGTQVSSALASIRRSLNEKLKQAKTKLGDLEAEFEEWQTLVLERDMAASQSQGTLRSRENIADSISDIARQTKSIEQLSTGLLVAPVGVNSLQTLHDALEQTVQTKLNRLREQINGLVEVDGLVGRFVSEQAHSEKLGNELITARQELDHIQKERALIAEKYSQLQREHLEAEAECDAIQRQLDRLNNETQAKYTLEQHKQAVEAAAQTLSSAESLATTYRNIHESNEQLSAENELINKQRKALKKTDDELLKARQLIEQWEKIIDHIASNDAIVKEEELQEVLLKNKLTNVTVLKVKAESNLLTVMQFHKALTSTADSIRQSVASIAAHLPDDRGDCPLCGAEHGAEDLHARINKSLEAIDPAVVEAEQRVKAASDYLHECSEAVTSAEDELKKCQNKIITLKSNHTRLNVEIKRLKEDLVFEGDTVQLAKESVQRRENLNASAKLQLNEKQCNLASLPTLESLEASKSTYQRAVHALESARQNWAGAQASLKQSTAALAAITADALPSKSLDALSIEKNKNILHLNKLKTKLTTEQASLNRQQIKLTEVNGKLTGIEQQLTEVQTKLAGIRYSWRQLSFQGDPAAEIANNKETQLKLSVADLKRHKEQLETIGIEIGTWSKLEQTRIAQGLINRRRGILSESKFVASLQQRIDSERSSLLQLIQLSEAMKTLNECLAAEISNAHKHVLRVVPRWQALLKRVVREQRFTDTNLGFRHIYRKGHAEVSVPLHGESVPVPAIASEAQLTDLQLTFLLSMALEHQWSSWRCLLLDDPTQHHDLVHAASVFDLLRDYIVDHGFQVVIATHDALQARYFMRKLQNDGIEARLWSLAPTPEGVTASEMKIAG